MRRSARLPAWATVDPDAKAVMRCMNRVQGQWVSPAAHLSVPDPLTGEPLISTPDTARSELQPFLASLKACTKSGLHNPLKRPQRYLEYANVARKAAHELAQPETEYFFARLIQRVMPKSYKQALGEVVVTRAFLQSFSGDSLRFLAGRSFNVSGDHDGQTSSGYRWPYGPVMSIAPFNFPLEIPALQMMAALFCGNKVLVKVQTSLLVAKQQQCALTHACAPSRIIWLALWWTNSLGCFWKAARPRRTLAFCTARAPWHSTWPSSPLCG